MSLETLTNRIAYGGNGTTTAFSFPYYFLEEGDLKVVLVDSNGTETVQTLTTHYTISGEGSTSGGTVTMLTAPASGASLVIIRNTELTQEISLELNGALPVDQVEKALDKLTMIIQRLDERLDRAVVLKETDANAVSLELPKVSDRASKFLAFDSDGAVIAASGTVSEVPVTAFMETLLDDSTASAARSTLEMGSSSAIRTLAGFGNSEQFITAGDMAAGAVHAQTEKTTAVTADEILLSDSAASYALKRMTLSNLFKNLDTQRNHLYNSNFDIWQRGATVTCANAATAYGPDRWYAENQLGTAGVITMTRAAGSSDGAKYGCEVKITTAPTASVANGTYLYQTLENFDSLRLYNKTASVFVKLKAKGYVTQVGIALMYKTTEAKVDTVIGSEQTVTVNSSTFSSGSISLQALGTSMTTAGVVGIRFRVVAVSQGAPYDLDNGFVVEQAMLVEGAVPTVFKPRFDSIQAEVQGCQRYYEKSYSLGTTPGTGTTEGIANFAHSAAAGNTNYWHGVSFKVTKRTAPTISLWDSAGTATKVDYDTTTNEPADAERAGESGFGVKPSGTDNRNGVSFHWAAVAEI